MTHPGGRPTKYHSDFVLQLEKAMQEGMTVERFCRNTRIHKDTFYAWVKKHKEFSDAFRGGKHDADAYWQEFALNNLDNRSLNTNLFKLYMANCHGWSDQGKREDIQKDNQNEQQFTDELKALVTKYQKDI
jgi:hypothetical protein